MKKPITLLSICTLIPIMLLTACNTNDGNNLNTNTRDVTYRPVNYGNEDKPRTDLDRNRVTNMNGVDLNGGNQAALHRFIAPLDPNGQLREFTHLDPGEEYNFGPEGNEKAQPPKQPSQEPNAGQPEPPAQNQPEQNAQPSDASGFVKQVIDLTNKERTKNGLSALKADGELENVAEMKSEDMKDKNYFSHTSPTYGSPFEMMQNFGVDYSSAAENIAVGQETPQSVVNAWMNSPGHRKNILNGKLTHIGVGIAKDESRGIYWTQMFIAK
ncbi:CAP domain-containing protein [Rossellomorea aquimaris]|uniref:CAP domain-containing protein n=1 Tax=Rossellomorea aquimaris TaxID=189382 RepID=UPI001CD2A4ED|nr:CAP domain-containing protein [Rossellomorea aquimaris]MCA1057039.1 CAP domain-containing protein [Rossellomorea aquimaris]